MTRNAVDEGMAIVWDERKTLMRPEAQEALRAHLQAMQDRLMALERVAEAARLAADRLDRLGSRYDAREMLLAALALLEPAKQGEKL